MKRKLLLIFFVLIITELVLRGNYFLILFLLYENSSYSGAKGY